MADILNCNIVAPLIYDSSWNCVAGSFLPTGGLSAIESFETTVVNAMAAAVPQGYSYSSIKLIQSYGVVPTEGSCLSLHILGFEGVVSGLVAAVLALVSAMAELGVIVADLDVHPTDQYISS